MKARVQIEGITPQVDCGRFAAKAVVGDRIDVAADVFREGHDAVGAAIRFRGPADTAWREAPLVHDVNDRWFGSFDVDVVGSWRYQVVGWTDHWRSWLHGLVKKYEAGVTDLDVELEEGARLLERRRVPRPVKEQLQSAAGLLRDADSTMGTRVAAADDPQLQALLDQHPERLDATLSKPELPLWVDREAARFSAWYELFPRSEGAIVHADGTMASGTFKTAAARLEGVAAMGFDVVYLPPIHPIGRAFRKGRNNSLTPALDDVGVPWAIGGPEGGHTAIHPDLGTLEDFDEFVSEARRLGMEVALDYALQVSPDHPWVTEHPDWFRHRADGTIAYAENPPKKYQDIYPIDFDTPDIEGLKRECKAVLDHWIAHGVTIFRVDNPHTKALPFWEWLIEAVHFDHPEVLFLAEAFTRPKVMKRLGKLGFSQSYTYFAWRTHKKDLTEYVEELCQTEVADFMRPNFWPNTPDILTDQLQHGGAPMFKQRLVLAATLSSNYGIYAGYELYESTAVRAGSEEYLDSEKYQLRPRDWDVPWSLAPWIARVNAIRRDQPALAHLRTIRFHHVGNDQLLCYSKVTPARTHPVLVVVNLDPHHAQAGLTWLDLWQLGMGHVHAFEAHELITDTRWTWHGSQNYVRLDPFTEPAHILALRPL